MIKSAAMLAKRKGIFAFKKSHIDTLSSDDTTKIMEPKGGVNPPIAIFSVMTMPKWTRSILSVFNIGTKSGAMMMMAGPPSTNIPTINKKILTSIKNTYLFAEMLNTACAIMCGMRS